MAARRRRLAGARAIRPVRGLFVRHSPLLTGRERHGKELVAQSIHYASRRSDGPCVAINCAALPENTQSSRSFAMNGCLPGAARGLLRSDLRSPLERLEPGWGLAEDPAEPVTAR